MSEKRRFKVRVRGKVRNRLLRRGGIAAGTALGVALAAWFSLYAAGSVRRLFSGPLFMFKPQAVEVDCRVPEAAGNLGRLAAAAAKKPLTSARASELAAEVRRLHPGFASVNISRNFITRKATIRAVPEEAVASVLSGGATSYLGISGRFMPERLSGDGVPFPVKLEHAPPSAPELAAFLSGLKPLAALFYSPPALLSCDGRSWDCRLSLEDGTEVVWGEFEFSRLKILRLNEVMEHALPKSTGPLRADLRSFGEGKIFVSALQRPVSPKAGVSGPRR